MFLKSFLPTFWIFWEHCKTTDCHGIIWSQTLPVLPPFFWGSDYYAIKPKPAPVYFSWSMPATASIKYGSAASLFSEKALVASQFDQWSSGLLVLLHLIFGLLWVIEHHARRLQHLECWPVFGVLHISKTSMLFGQPEETRTCSEADCFIYLHHLNSFEVVLCMSLECSIDQNTSVFWGAWET